MDFIDQVWKYLEQDDDAAPLIEMRGELEEPFSKEQVRRWVRGGRSTLAQLGIRAGDRVVLVAPNSAQWVAADLSFVASGVVSVPLYARLQPDELTAVIRDCKPKLVVGPSDGLRALGCEAEAPVMNLDQFLAGSTDVGPPRKSHPADLLTLVYTSGTSGTPKGVMLTAGNLEYMLGVTKDALAAIAPGRTAPDRVYHYLPFCFAGSRIMLWTALYRATPLHVGTNLQELRAEFANSRPHYMLNVPAFLERMKTAAEDGIRKQGKTVSRLYEAGWDAFLRQHRGTARGGDALVVALVRAALLRKVRKKLGDHLECLICGSAPLAVETQLWFEMLGIPVYQVYGLTETTGIVTMDTPRRARPGRVGRAIPGCETQIDDNGELLVRGPNVFAGYWNREEETESAFRDGWFCTGDLAETDDTGNHQIIGRIKNVVIPTTGHNVAPEPLEERLVARIPGAQHAVIFGHGKPFLTAVISGTVDEAEARRRIDGLNQQLPHYRKVRGFVVTRETFTPENGLLTANQKLRRSALEAHFHKQIEKLYS